MECKKFCLHAIRTARFAAVDEFDCTFYECPIECAQSVEIDAVTEECYACDGEGCDEDGYTCDVCKGEGVIE